MQVVESDWFKTDYWTTLVGLSLKSKIGDADGFGELECVASPFGNGEETEYIENQEKRSVTELELKSLPLRKTRVGRQ